MKLRCMFETMELDDRIVAVPIGEGSNIYNGVLKLNETGAIILEILREDTSEEIIADAITQRYNISRDEALKDVHLFIEELRTRGFLVED